MLVVAALGGNALLRRGQTPDAAVQERNVATAVAALAPLAAAHELVITHGNGPQVGVLALQSASDPNLTTPYPFDVLGAQTQGMIGYWLLQSMQNALPRRQVAAIINQTLVEAHDPAFANQISRQLGAKFYITGKVGSVDEFFNKERRVQYTLFIQVIEVETSLVRFQYKSERSKAIVR